MNDSRQAKAEARPDMVPAGRRWRIAGAAMIFCAVLLAYWPALWAGFVWNDSDYVTAPELRSWQGLRRIWLEVGATQQYYPFLHSAFWVEHRLWGDTAAGYHAVNLLLHAISACLFMILLMRLWGGAGPPARPLGFGSRRRPALFFAPLFGGLIFALHPVCVESVAWITEQKNTLSTVFYLLAAIFYLRFHERRELTEAGREVERVVPNALVRPPSRASALGSTRSTSAPWPYLLGLIFFVLAVLSKSVAATLPGALLVVIWWQRGKLSWRRDVLPLLPWFVVGAAAGLFTGWVERKYVGAEGPAFALTLMERFEVAGRVVWFYLGKTLWPAHLIFIYPRWPVAADKGGGALPALGALALLAALWAFRQESRAPLAGFLLFVGGLFPLLGFFNVYAFVFSFVADHWQYLAMFGIIALGAGGWGRALEAGRRWPLSAPILYASAAAVVALFGVQTWRECRTFHDPETFYRTILLRNPAAWMAHNNLGNLLAALGRTGEAKKEYAEALRLRPEYPDALTNYGLILANEGRLAEALEDYAKALRIGPDEPRTRNDLGIALARSGRDAAAIEQYRRGLRLNPGYAELHHNLALALLRSGRPAEAAGEYRAVIALKPADPYAHYDLGIALAEIAGQREAAKAEWEEALRLKPDLPLAHLRLGSWFRAAGQIGAALAEDEAALRLDPALAIGHNNLGNALRDAGRLAEAMTHYETAIRLDPNYAEAQNNFGAALATLGRLREAIDHFQRAVALAPNFYPAQLNLARSLQAAGRPAEARIHFDAAKRLRVPPRKWDDLK